MDADERIQKEIRQHGLEQMRQGDLIDRLKYLYVTKLSNYAIFRLLRAPFTTTVNLVLFYIFMFIPCLLYVAVMVVWGTWKTRRDESAYSSLGAQYRNRDQGWHDLS